MSDALFVTGASGYVGRRLIRRLSDRHRRIVCLARSPDALSSAIDGLSKVQVVVGDLTAPESYEDHLAQCQAVVHLAAVTGKAPAKDYFRVNSHGTRCLVEAGKRCGVGQFLHVSTIATKFRDQSRYYYAQSKQQAEDCVAASGLAYTILRPTIIIGPDAPVLTGLSKMAGAPRVPIFGNGRAMVQPIYVLDLVDCIVDIIDQQRFNGEAIDVGGPDQVTIEEFLDLIRMNLFGKPPAGIHIPLAPVRAMLGLLERLLLPVLPLTAGQLASFANDGVCEPHPFIQSRVSDFKSVDAVLKMTGEQ